MKIALNRFEKLGNFHKVSGDTAFGWAFISAINGVPYFDTGDGKHSDHIPEDSIDEVAALFMEKSRAGLEMHSGEQVADVLFSYPMTDAIMKGVEVSSAKTGLLIGWRPYDKALLGKVASGERLGFSIGGIVDAWDIVGVDGQVLEHVCLSDKAARPLQVTFGKFAGPADGGMKRRIFRSWKLHEISLVDRPMQEGALVGVVKSKGKQVQVPAAYKKVRTIARAIYKQALLTSVEDGHQHLVDMDDFDDDGDARTSYEQSSTADYGHDHAVVRNADGTLTVAMNEGHDHTVEVPALADGRPDGVTAAATVEMRAKCAMCGSSTKNAKCPGCKVSVVDDGSALAQSSIAMRAPDVSLTREIGPSSLSLKSQPQLTETPMTEQEIQALKTAKARAEKLAELNDAQRAYVKCLSESDADAFVAKSAADRAAVLKAAVAYTSDDGSVYYAHDDQRLVTSVKAGDETKKSLVLEQQLRKRAEFEKQAAQDMGAYPEACEVHAAIIQAVEGIADETMRKAARKVLLAGNAALQKASRSTGTNGSVDKRPGVDNALAKAELKLKTAVEAFGKSANITDYAVAFAQGSGSDPAVREAFDEVSNLRRGRQPTGDGND